MLSLKCCNLVKNYGLGILNILMQMFNVSSLCIRGFRSGPTHTGLYSQSILLEASIFRYWKLRVSFYPRSEIKALIS